MTVMSWIAAVVVALATAAVATAAVWAVVDGWRVRRTDALVDQLRADQAEDADGHGVEADEQLIGARRHGTQPGPDDDPLLLHWLTAIRDSGRDEAGR